MCTLYVDYAAPVMDLSTLTVLAPRDWRLESSSKTYMDNIKSQQLACPGFAKIANCMRVCIGREMCECAGLLYCLSEGCSLHL